MRTNIQTKSKEWYAMKEKTIGASEIFALIFHYIAPNELQRAGINNEEFTEKPYTTAWHLYHKFTNPACYVNFELDVALELFGEAIEGYALDCLRKDTNCVYEKGGVYKEGNTSASLDIEGKVKTGGIVRDVNGLNISTSEHPSFAVEVKAQSKFLSTKQNILQNGVDWKFIFQLQYQMMVANLEWGKILVFNLENDNAFERGRVCGFSKQKLHRYMKANSTMHEFVYKKRPEYQFLIKKALERFQMDIDTQNEPNLPSWELLMKNPKQAHCMLYNITLQRAKLFENKENYIESDAFDEYFRVKSEQEILKQKLDAVQWKIRNTMSQHGKTEIVGNLGKIVMQKNAVVGRQKLVS